ncbi:ATPase components of ABC transporters with duplicated ATPase domains [Lentilactobacillus kosonis]|uniref:ATPase components of ABC transporters with duplicated ATPase domains n=1 Tax=Lentilactobacillus kosonis TaxID=2810561 RepID=A0A401FM08_9LACO|nr:ATPase components of ABC transporters with duplicated ATPase domains [Lentilactobacillus kosonis]
MPLLEVSDLSMSFAEKDLYQDAEFQLEKGDHMGIVGQNGVGKSTLIKIITGSILPLSGNVKWQKNIKIGYLDQYADVEEDLTLTDFLRTAFADMYEKNRQLTKIYEDYAETGDDKLMERAGQLQDDLDAGNFYELDTEIEQTIVGLGLDSIGRDHLVGKMSGGQRSKAILAKMLLANPDVILLDEPTNYLDTAQIDWLVEYINSFKGAVLVVSHDYDFLEQITNCIINVAFGKSLSIVVASKKQCVNVKSAKSSNKNNLISNKLKLKKLNGLSGRIKLVLSQQWLNLVRRN